VKPAPHSNAAAYGDRRMQGVHFVDYSSPGFAVVFVDGPEVPTGQLELTIRGGRVTRLEPSYGAVGAGGRVSVVNAASEAHVLSYPAAGLLRRLGPGERIEVDVAQPGEQGLFLLGSSGAAATVFAAPGPYAVLSSAGRFELRGLAPGHREIHAWHPRFPPASRTIELAPDARVEVDLEIGVGRGDSEPSEGGAEAHAHDH
jgi:hypothetical protein